MNFHEKGFYKGYTHFFDVAVDGQYAYLAAAGSGLLVVDISDPVHPAEVGSYDTPGYSYGIGKAGDMVYIADGWGGVRVVGVGNPAQLTEIASYDTPGWAFDVIVVDSKAYVADTFAGLHVLDVSDPVHPVELGGHEWWRGHAGRVAVSGDAVYVADRNWGIRVVWMYPIPTLLLRSASMLRWAMLPYTRLDDISGALLSMITKSSLSRIWRLEL
jgi:hypothetical protein